MRTLLSRHYFPGSEFQGKQLFEQKWCRRQDLYIRFGRDFSTSVGAKHPASLLCHCLLIYLMYQIRDALNAIYCIASVATKKRKKDLAPSAMLSTSYFQGFRLLLGQVVRDANAGKASKLDLQQV